MNSKILNLIEEANSLQPADLIPNDILNKVSNELGVVFSNDFLEIAKKYHFEFLSFFDWSGLKTGAIEYTKKLRLEGLPQNYLILAGFRDDGGSVFLETPNDPNTNTRVIWCDMEDVYNLCLKGEFEYNPTIWPSFTDFFEYLVEQEEEMLKEQEK